MDERKQLKHLRKQAETLHYRLVTLSRDNPKAKRLVPLALKRYERRHLAEKLANARPARWYKVAPVKAETVHAV